MDAVALDIYNTISLLQTLSHWKRCLCEFVTSSHMLAWHMFIWWMCEIFFICMFYFCVSVLFVLAHRKDWKYGETANLALSKGNENWWLLVGFGLTISWMGTVTSWIVSRLSDSHTIKIRKSLTIFTWRPFCFYVMLRVGTSLIRIIANIG